jgi:hypothetical protein
MAEGTGASQCWGPSSPVWASLGKRRPHCRCWSRHRRCPRHATTNDLQLGFPRSRLRDPNSRPSVRSPLHHGRRTAGHRRCCMAHPPVRQDGRVPGYISTILANRTLVQRSSPLSLAWQLTPQVCSNPWLRTFDSPTSAVARTMQHEDQMHVFNAQRQSDQHVDQLVRGRHFGLVTRFV